MFTQFYGFTEKPFELVPNPNYLYLSSRHGNALTFLEYGIMENVGFIVLTGEIGIGKTTLIRYLLNQVEKEMDVAVIFNTNIVPEDLIKLILNEFEIPYDDTMGKAKAQDLLYDFLIEKYTRQRKVLLIIDEAQNLSHEVLEEIRMLSNLQTDEEMLLQIMIIGQPNLRDKIQDPALKQFAQRIAVSYHLSAMSLEETAAYIAHRLKKAGGSPLIFPTDVIEKIFYFSGGIPRTINLLCDAALVYGYADELDIINCDILEQVIENKGGMGIFTTTDTTTPPPSPEKNTIEALEKDRPKQPGKNCLPDTNEQISHILHRIEQLEKTLQNQLNEAETRAEFCRDELISSLKHMITFERKRNASLAYAYGKLKGKNNHESPVIDLSNPV